MRFPVGIHAKLSLTGDNKEEGLARGGKCYDV